MLLDAALHDNYQGKQVAENLTNSGYLHLQAFYMFTSANSNFLI